MYCMDGVFGSCGKWVCVCATIRVATPHSWALACLGLSQLNVDWNQKRQLHACFPLSTMSIFLFCVFFFFLVRHLILCYIHITCFSQFSFIFSLLLLSLDSFSRLFTASLCNCFHSPIYSSNTTHWCRFSFHRRRRWRRSTFVTANALTKYAHKKLIYVLVYQFAIDKFRAK